MTLLCPWNPRLGEPWSGQPTLYLLGEDGMSCRRTAPLLFVLLTLGCNSLSVLPFSGAVALGISTNPEMLRRTGRSASQLVRRVGYRLERFHWAEYPGDEPGGGTLLDETGATHAFGYSVRFRDFNVRLSTELLIGDVDYDGQTMAGVPVTTETMYSGLEFDAVWLKEMRFRYWDEFCFLVGGTTRSWSRDIKSTSSAMGYVEDWFVLGASFGISAVRRTPAGGDFFFEVQGYLPLLADEEIEGVELDPDGRFSLLSELKAGYAWENGVSVAFRLRRLGFDVSPRSSSRQASSSGSPPRP